MHHANFYCVEQTILTQGTWSACKSISIMQSNTSDTTEEILTTPTTTWYVDRCVMLSWSVSLFLYSLIIASCYYPWACFSPLFVKAVSQCVRKLWSVWVTLANGGGRVWYGQLTLFYGPLPRGVMTAALAWTSHIPQTHAQCTTHISHSMYLHMYHRAIIFGA